MRVEFDLARIQVGREIMRDWCASCLYMQRAEYDVANNSSFSAFESVKITEWRFKRSKVKYRGKLREVCSSCAHESHSNTGDQGTNTYCCAQDLL
jgi:hypothetical protein